FIQRIAHEVRTPLTVVMGYFNLLFNDPDIQALCQNQREINNYMQFMQDGLERMRILVEEIVMISRLGTGKVEVAITPIPPTDLLEAAIRPFSAALEQRQIELNLYYDNLPTYIHGDADLLRLALINVIGNAIKYTPDEGEVSISLTQVRDNLLRIMIKDTGIGIDPDEQQRIFETFYSAENISLHSTSKTNFQGGGLGLGLTIAKAVIELHSGHIYVESEGCDNERMPGSTFYIELPIDPQTQANRQNLYQSFNQ
ncbi:MAG: hypothetical protein CUN55_15415, partial [Phototrophicales bacterium]